MKTNLTRLATLLLLCLCAAGAHAAAFTTGNVVVTQVGDGSTTLNAGSFPISVLEYLPSAANQSSPVQTIGIPSTGGSRLTMAGNSGSEGLVTRSTNASIITFAGYDVDAGVVTIGQSNATTIPRCAGKLDASGNFTRIATGSSMYSGTASSVGNPRSAVSDGAGYWMGGTASTAGNGGIWYSASGGTPTQIGAGNTTGNLRATRIFNGTLYFSTSSGTVGIWAYTGTPTSGASAANIFVTAGSPYDFAISPAGNVAYVADDGALSGTGGIQKWTFNGSTWAKKFTFGSSANTASNNLTAGCHGLAVDFSGPNPVIYATGTAGAGNKLIKITDTSAFADTGDSVDQAIILATSPANTSFAGVALAPTTSPVMVSQPSDVNNALTGTTISMTVNTTTGGLPLFYQWYYTNTNTKLVDGSSGFGGTISGSTGATLTLTSVAVAQSGGYRVVITNTSGSITSRVAQVTIVTAPVPPTIDANITPVGSTNTIGDGVTFSVTAHGVPAVAYQWKFIPDTNTLMTNILAGATSSSLPLANLTTNQSGKYFVTITNSTSYFTTNSALAALKVNPPQFVTIAALRGMVDGTFAPTNTTAIFTAQGIVTTWNDMTGLANTEFYMQDASGGICVFWSGANGSTNLPPAGALVQVTGPLSSFTGLLEMAPVFGNALESVTIISTNNPLPKPQPLVFDPLVSGYPATGKTAAMNALEGMYFVASNVMLNLSTPTFASGANDIITNNAQKTGVASNNVLTVNFTNGAGQQYILFINAQSGLPGQAKYTGPVTIYGILGYFTSAGFEFTPSRFADVISYTHVTNVVSNITRAGDLPTNSYVENFLEPGETMTTFLNIGDAAGGSVTLSPVTAGLPASAGWSNVTNGLTGTAIFHFTPVTGDSGMNYPISVGVTSTAGSVFTNTFTVYVPSATEQQVSISEFLANPTTNTGAANFNPLKRSSDTTSISTNDQYIELVNLSGSDIDTSSGANGWEVDQGGAQVMVFDALGSPPLISSSNAIVIYGGGTPTPTLPANSYASTAGKLSLPVSGTGTLVLRNGNGNIVDRVVYSASDLSTNGSLSRFPTINSAFVPQPYISTNVTTAGLQYDGSPWNQPFKVPAGVNNVGISVVNGQAIFNFPANTTQASTLWGASTVTGPYSVLFGGLFPGGMGSFTNSATGAQQFFYISTQ